MQSATQRNILNRQGLKRKDFIRWRWCLLWLYMKMEWLKDFSGKIRGAGMRHYQYALMFTLLFFINTTPADTGKSRGTLTQLNAGDIACYAGFIDEQGLSFSEMADFGICERTDLIGQQVYLEYKEANVYAASCQGNMDCPDTETVKLVAHLEPVNSMASDGSKCFDNAVTQSALNQCAANDYKNAESEMEKVYAAVRKKYRDDPKRLEKLKLSQDSWINFRDAEASARYPHQDEPGYYGSVFPLCMNVLLMQLMQDRTVQLKSYLKSVEEGDVCAY